MADSLHFALVKNFARLNQITCGYSMYLSDKYFGTEWWHNSCSQLEFLFETRGPGLKVDGDDVDWDTDYELEIENFTLSSSANPGSGSGLMEYPVPEDADSILETFLLYNPAQISKAEDGHLPLEEMHTHLRSEYPWKNKRKLCESSLLKRKRIMGDGNQIIGEDAGAIHLPNPMNGFGTPADLCQIHRSLPEAATL
ncbi:hypothetical protein J5N97_000407 [Dioscorea zingiberensis]|uniref:Uncharacterized protein n=1 Tax=Dioscorea zingiberensis TaxID=325984 RepID=A0A9D5BSF9_9LILI|nr:hypothetical protein J5N97_000407 [Dioscorea zingiberensis]